MLAIIMLPILISHKKNLDNRANLKKQCRKLNSFKEWLGSTQLSIEST